MLRKMVRKLFAPRGQDLANARRWGLSGFRLEWTHPGLADAHRVEIREPARAARLAAVFGDAAFLRACVGSPWDCPMYDVTVQFFRMDGSMVPVQVYLPRKCVFHGLWKHPSCGALHYFDSSRNEPRLLMAALHRHVPVHMVYPRKTGALPHIPHHHGIPDFREIHLPLLRDGSRNTHA